MKDILKIIIINIELLFNIMFDVLSDSGANYYSHEEVMAVLCCAVLTSQGDVVISSTVTKSFSGTNPVISEMSDAA